VSRNHELFASEKANFDENTANTMSKINKINEHYYTGYSVDQSVHIYFLTKFRVYSFHDTES